MPLGDEDIISATLRVSDPHGQPLQRLPATPASLNLQVSKCLLTVPLVLSPVVLESSRPFIGPGQDGKDQTAGQPDLVAGQCLVCTMPKAASYVENT